MPAGHICIDAFELLLGLLFLLHLLSWREKNIPSVDLHSGRLSQVMKKNILLKIYFIIYYHI